MNRLDMTESTLPPIAEGLSFASILIKAREDKGYTQRQLSEVCGISISAIKAYESGRNMPGARELRELCQAMKVSPNMMLFGVESPFEAQSSIELLLRAGNVPVGEYQLPQRLGVLATLMAPEERDSLLTLATSLAIARHGKDAVLDAIRKVDVLSELTKALMAGTGKAIRDGTEIDSEAIASTLDRALQDSGFEPKELPKK